MKPSVPYYNTFFPPSADIPVMAAGWGDPHVGAENKYHRIALFNCTGENKYADHEVFGNKNIPPEERGKYSSCRTMQNSQDMFKERGLISPRTRKKTFTYFKGFFYKKTPKF